ncbi:hypothetical protein [Caulobacter sp. DWR1-3-2b1]|uniref:hypothetical protein n=1 Tax=Caulobacter sp. DWR1-3-2b1 TaxID=2804670 RepID=UPI003CF63246
MLDIGALILSLLTTLAAVAAATFAALAWRENKRSANVAERMLTGYERPFLLLEVVQSGIVIDGSSIAFGVTKYQFRNLGRVPALLIRRHFELESGDVMPEPIDPQKEAGQAVVHGIAVGANATSDQIDVGSAQPLVSAFKRFRQSGHRTKMGRPSVYFHGFVEYRDLAGRVWITGFCFAHSDNEIGFQLLSLAERDGPDPYNYDRQVG